MNLSPEITEIINDEVSRKLELMDRSVAALRRELAEYRAMQLAMVNAKWN